MSYLHVARVIWIVQIDTLQTPPTTSSPTSTVFEPPNAMCHPMNDQHAAPCSSYSMIRDPRKSAVGNYPGPMTSFPPPPYKPHPRILDSTTKLPGRDSNDMNHPPPYRQSRTAIAERVGKHRTKGDDNMPRPAHGMVSRILNRFRKGRNDSNRESNGSEWPPKGTKYITDPGLPLRLISPFDPKCSKLKARAKTQEEWEELRIIRGGNLQPSSSRKPGNKPERRNFK